MKKFLVKLVAPLVIGLFLFACSSTSSNSGGNSPPEEKAPDNSQTPANNGGQNSASEGGEINIQLPLSPDIPPADVIQQISWTGGGGSDGPDGPVCSNNCFNTDEDAIFLTYFQPNQQIRITIFYPTGVSQAGAGVYRFFTEIPVITDNNGSVIIHSDRNTERFLFIVIDENGNLIYVPKGAVDIQYESDESNCPGQLPSRLSVSLKAQVITSSGIPLQLNPDTSQDNYFVDLDEGTVMTIQAGPQCNEEMVWWQVGAILSDGIYGGWVAEGDQNSWYIEPIK